MATTTVTRDVVTPIGTATAGLPVVMTTTIAIVETLGTTMIVHMPPIPADVAKVAAGSAIPRGMRKPPVVAGMTVKDHVA